MVGSSRRWVIPDAMTPGRSTAPEQSHESLCVLSGEEAVTLVLEAYFEDREPEVSAPIRVEARRSLHLRLDAPDRIGGLRVPVGVPYGLIVIADGPLWVQYSRLDTAQSAYALMTALPSPELV